MTLRVVCPYTRLDPTTEKALRAQAPTVEFRDVSDSPVSFWAVWVDLWRAQEDFMLVEHDVEIAPGTVEALEACPEPWCACAANDDYGYRLGAAFQCNRFRAEVMRRRPEVFEMPLYCRHWIQLDSLVLTDLTRTFWPHLHKDLPTVHHHVDSPERSAAIKDSFRDFLAGFAEDAPRLLAEGIADERFRNRIALAPVMATLRRRDGMQGAPVKAAVQAFRRLR